MERSGDGSEGRSRGGESILPWSGAAPRGEGPTAVGMQRGAKASLWRAHGPQGQQQWGSAVSSGTLPPFLGCTENFSFKKKKKDEQKIKPKPCRG